tara:strand:+ start:1009 stop:1323 length:315 start_codon:yes stop_codon:yes gene_type:complete
MQEALQRLLGDVSQMKTLGDADLPWLVELESMVVSKIREPIDMMKQPGGPLAGAGGPPPGMGGGMGGPPPGGGMPAGSPMGGGMNAGAQAPNPDELQRLLSAGA